MIIYFIDIILILNTGFFEKGALILNRKEIIKHYFNEYFFIDLITLGPIIF